MSGTKIFVLQMKDVIRIGLFAILGIAAVVMLVFLFIPKNEAAAPPEADAQYIPGAYSSSIILNGNPLDITVTVSEREIVSVEMTDLDNVQRVFYPLFEPEISDLASQVLEFQTAEFALDTEYPVTNGILRDAISTALAQAYPEETE